MCDHLTWALDLPAMIITVCQIDKCTKKIPRQQSKIKAHLDSFWSEKVPLSIVHPSLVLKKMSV